MGMAPRRQIDGYERIVGEYANGGARWYACDGACEQANRHRTVGAERVDDADIAHVLDRAHRAQVGHGIRECLDRDAELILGGPMAKRHQDGGVRPPGIDAHRLEGR